MTRHAPVLIIALVGIAAVAVPAAQQQAMPSLAEVARKAEAAKPTTRKATKTFTNADLSADPRGAGAPAAEAAPAPAAAPSDDGFVSKSPGKAVAAEEMVTRSEAKAEEEAVAKESEETWRHRASSLRQQIDKMRERLTQLSTPNPLTEASPALKTANERDIVNARAALDAQRKQWARLETAAREKKIPLAWIEPLPSFQ